MGWLNDKINRWAVGKQDEELRSFIEMLKAMDSSELGWVVACATHVRHALEAKGHEVMDPIVYMSKNPDFAVVLNQLIRDCQKQSRPHDAASLMVWLHTMRGATSLELRGLAREMWSELARGFPHVDASVVSLKNLGGQPLNTLGATEFPNGFSPKPL